MRLAAISTVRSAVRQVRAYRVVYPRRMTTLFDPLQVGDIAVSNRLVMAPLTRNRAAPGRVPSALAIEYYAQRASAGLLITEASQISPQGQGYLDTPGIYNAEQVAAWRRITDAVHARG